ncbi:MAG: 30S ribosomal protein S4 [Armatimonadota bacterium]|nr:30S ribosomal protein S4 [Armatimonadota bacterium]
MAMRGSPVCRLCRREGEKLYLKGDRCYSRKCGVERRDYQPGQHGPTARPSKLSSYGEQLREKQKTRRIYGVRERQFRNYVEEAERQRGVTGENLLRLLEIRLDNVVYRAGFATSRSQARQFVNHGHFMVNGRRVDIPSFLVRPGNTVEVIEKSRKIPQLVSAPESAGARAVPGWLKIDANAFKATIETLPIRDDIDTDVREQLIVEFYSR